MATPSPVARPVGECSVSGCDRPTINARGWCSAHYLRWYRTGDVGSGRPVVPKEPGAACMFEGCEKPRAGRGFCAQHYTRLKRHGDPGTTKKPNPRRRAENPAWVGDAINYGGMHQRVTRERGRAALQSCATCSAQAEEWAYDHLDPGEKSETIVMRGASYDLPFSLSVEHYQAMCRPCHREMDGNGQPVRTTPYAKPVGQCPEAECGRVEALRRGLCATHYNRWYRANRVTAR